MDEKKEPNYYAIIPATVRYDKELSDRAKLLYGEITALADKNGYCYATNAYFAKLYDVHPVTISKTVSQLAKRGYIRVKIYRDPDTKEVEQRRLTPISDRANTPINAGAKKNTTRANNNRKEKARWIRMPELQPGQRVIITVVNDNEN